MQLVKKKRRKKKSAPKPEFPYAVCISAAGFSLQRAEICQICGEKVFLQRQTCLAEVGCVCFSASSRGPEAEELQIWGYGPESTRCI